MINCDKCEAELPDEAMFCLKCGNKLQKKIICPKCDKELPSESVFCFMCGENLQTNTTEDSLQENSKKQLEEMPIDTQPQQTKIDEIDIPKFSLKIYNTICDAFCEKILERINRVSESDHVHKIVKILAVDNIKSDMKLGFNKTSKELKKLDLGISNEEIDNIVNKVSSSNLTAFDTICAHLSKRGEEVLEYDFPQGTLDGLMKGAYTGLVSEEAAIGAVVGSVVPGIGTVVGAAIGGWIAGDKKDKEEDEIWNRYAKSKDELFEEFDNLWRAIYDSIVAIYLHKNNIQLQTCKTIEEENEKYAELMDEATELFDQEKYDLTLQTLKKAQKLRPEQPNAYYIEGLLLSEQEDFQEAINCFEVALCKDEEYATNVDDFFEDLGFYYGKVGDLSNSEKYLKRALQIDGDSALANLYLAYLYHDQNIDSKARQHLEQAIRNGFTDFSRLDNTPRLKEMQYEILKNSTDLSSKCVENIILSYKQNFEDSSIYFFPDIPEKKLQNVLDTYGKYEIATNEKVILLVDSTFWGSAKKGLVLTEDKLVCCTDSNKLKFAYKDIENVEVREKDEIKSFYINHCITDLEIGIFEGDYVILKNMLDEIVNNIH